VGKNVDARANDIATNIRVELARRHTTQTKLARHLNLSGPAITRRMAGSVAWRLTELNAVADYLAIPLNTLINGNEEVAS